MTADRALATRLVALRIVKDWITQADKDTRAQLLEVAVQGDRITAAVNTADGTVPIGSVTATKPGAGSITASIVDDRALLAWCKEFRPQAVTEIVRVTDQKALLEEIKTYGGVMDKTTGLVTEVPGVIVSEPSPGEPGLMVRPAEDAEAVIRAAVQSGELLLTDLAPLPIAGGS